MTGFNLDTWENLTNLSKVKSVKPAQTTSKDFFSSKTLGLFLLNSNRCGEGLRLVLYHGGASVGPRNPQV